VKFAPGASVSGSGRVELEVAFLPFDHREAAGHPRAAGPLMDSSSVGFTPTATTMCTLW